MSEVVCYNCGDSGSVEMRDDDDDFLYCPISIIGETTSCEYKCKNRNKMRVHVRTQHKKYFCSELIITPGHGSKLCRELFDQHRDWKMHLVQVHNKK